MRFARERPGLEELGKAAAWAVALAIAVQFVRVGLTLAGSTSNDAAYYFGVARHIAETHRYEEPIVWHFLVKPLSVLHRPFDYWHGLVSLTFVPIFTVFGASYRVAGAAMGVISGASVLAFTHLVTSAAPLRNVVVRLVAIVLFGLSPALVIYRFDVETSPFVHLWMLLSLIALAGRRFPLAAGLACVAFLSRADAVVLTIILCGAALWGARTAEPRHGTPRVALVIAVSAAAYVGYHLVVFRTPFPPGAAIAGRLVDGIDLYSWERQPETLTLGERLDPAFLWMKVRLAVRTLQEVKFVPMAAVWFGLAISLGLRWRRARMGPVEGTSWLLLFAGAPLIAYASPAVFARHRTLHTLLPVVVLSGAYAADAWLHRLRDVVRARASSPSAPRAALGALSLALAALMLAPLSTKMAPPQPPAFAAELGALAPVLGTEPSMTQNPWYLMATTHSPTVFVPEDGEATMEKVIRRYGVRWLVLLRTGCTGPSSGACKALLEGGARTLGGLRLTERVSNQTLLVLRVED
jgi:hypothetical protein